MSDKQLVYIPLDELNLLYDCKLMLTCLEESGVDNWEGYDQATTLYCKRNKASED